MKQFIFLALSFIVMLAPLQARAADTISSLPPEMRRLWAEPACDNVKGAFLYTDRFVLEASYYGNLLYRIGPVLRHNNVYRLGIADLSKPVLLDDVNLPYDLQMANGMLRRYDLPLFLPKGAVIDDREDYLYYYLPCDSFRNRYTTLDQEGLDAIKALDRADAVCGTVPIRKSPACQQAVFEIFDANKDQGLSRDELAGAYRQITFAGASMGCKTKTYFPGATATEGPLFADEIAAVADKDADGSITLDELQQGWEAVTQREHTKKLSGFLGNLATLLTFLPPGETMPDCSCIPVKS